jgi:hypothetical protein
MNAKNKRIKEILWRILAGFLLPIDLSIRAQVLGVPKARPLHCEEGAPRASLLIGFLPNGHPWMAAVFLSFE